MSPSQLLLAGLLAGAGLLTCPAAGAAAPSVDELLGQTVRYPVIGVPLVEKEPAIDGEIGDDEWSAASVIPDLIYDAQNTSQRNGIAAQHRSRYLLMYTADALFVAARYDVPEYAGGPAVSDIWSNQDAVDIYLNPFGKFAPGEKWHISGAASGKFWGRDLATDHVPKMDDTKMQYQARALKDGWEMELRLPFAVLETPTPAPAELWRANFLAVRRMPIPSVSAWSFLRGWRQPPRGLRDGWLVFMGQPLGARFERGSMELNRDGVQILVTGALPPEGVEAIVQLHKRKSQPTPQDPGLIAQFGEMLDNTTVGASNTYGMSFADVFRLIQQELDPVGDPVKKKLASSGERSITVKAAELGEYLLTYQLVAGQGDRRLVLAGGSLPMRIEPPVSLTVNAFELRHGKRRFDIDYSTLAELAQAKTVKLVVAAVRNQATVAAQSVPAEKGFAQIELPSKEWSPGEYTASAEVYDASGAALGSAKTLFEKPTQPDWFTQPEGFEPEVPKPWSPVKAKLKRGKQPGASVNVWGRDYRFAGLPLPASVRATPSPLSKADPPQAPVEILAAPMKLAVTAGGQELPWKTKEFKLESKRPSEVVFVSRHEAEGLTLRAKTKVEFDGMIRVDFSLASATRPMKIEKLDLVIPYRAEVAELMSTYRKAPGPGTLLNRYLGKVPAEPWKYAVFYTHFIGNNKVGLEWFCDSMKGWRVKKGDEAVEVVRSGDRVNLTFHLVDHEVTLEKPLEITFGLIATPAKPLPLGWEILRFDQQAYLPPLPGEKLKGGKPATQEDTDAWVRRMQYARVKVNLMFGWAWSGVEWFQQPVRRNPELMARLKKKFDMVHAAGAKMCPWGSWYCIPTSLPEWPLWGSEMAAQPLKADLGKSFTACYNSPFTDFLVANFAANARDVGIDGMRHDTIAPPVECHSEYHGCGWRDSNGKLWPSQNLFAAREYFKRLYRVFHGGVRQDGLCYFPLAGPPINAFDSFVDIHEIGEGSFEKALTLKEGYPPDDVRVRMVGSAYGFVTSNNLKGAPLTIVERCAALLVAGAWPRFAFAGNSAVERIGYQNYWPNNWQNTLPTWNAFEWIDYGNSALWRPYWENAGTLELEPPRMSNGQLPEVYGSYYFIPGKRLLLIVTNYEREPLAGLVARLELKKLDFAAGAKLYGKDAVTQEPVELRDGVLALDLFPQRYRMIQISAEKPKLHADNLGENLLASGGFEDWSPVQIKHQVHGQEQPFAEHCKSVKHTGGACLQITKTVKQLPYSGYLELPPCAVSPGWHLLSGYLRIEKDFDLASEQPGSPGRPDCSFLSISVGGEGVQYDPPAEFCGGAGLFQIREKTSGWLRFVLPFQATAQTKEVKVGVGMQGVGVAWVDDLEIRKIK